MIPTNSTSLLPRLFSGMLALLAAATATVASTPGDEHWDSQFGSVGANDYLQAITVKGSNVFIGGIFTAAGNTRANAVAGYDGTNWFPLNNGMSGVAGLTYLSALAADGIYVYAGGYFTNADGSGARYLARWDGANWSPLGTGVGSLVTAIKVIGSNVYVGGAFITAGGQTADGFARWDGSSWTTFGGGITGGTVPFVGAIESDGTNLYVGGSFTTAGVTPAANVACWNGSSWIALGAGLNGQVSALLFQSNKLYAAGGFTNAGTLSNLAVWNGSAWSSWAPTDRTARELLTDGTNIYAAGDFTNVGGVSANRVAKWDGHNWSALGTGLHGFGANAQLGVSRMAFDSSHRLYVAGNFNQAGNIGASHVAGWDGTNWFALGGTTGHGLTHFAHPAQSLGTDGTNIYAGGLFSEAGTNVVNGIAKWDRTNWWPLGNGITGSGVVLAVAQSGSVVYAGGSFTNIGGVTVGYCAKWDGSSWSPMGSGFSATVKSLVIHRGVLFAGGSFTTRGDAAVDLHGIAQWNGSDWAAVPLIESWQINNSINALVSDGQNLYAGGDFFIGWGFSPQNPTVGDNVSYVGRWDGTNWWSLGNGLNTVVNALALQNGSLYAGGSFTTSGSTAMNRVARWDGSVWSAVGNGFNNGNVSSLVPGQNVLYASGTFTNASPVFGKIARWDGTNWTSLGSGLLNNPGNPNGYSMAMLGSDLYLGGLFLFAGDKPAVGFSRWNEQLNFYPSPNPRLTPRSPPASGQFQFRFSGTSGQTYVLQGSTNLSSWVPLLTNTAPIYDFTDTSASNFPRRFYRAVVGTN